MNQNQDVIMTLSQSLMSMTSDLAHVNEMVEKQSKVLALQSQLLSGSGNREQLLKDLHALS